MFPPSSNVSKPDWEMIGLGNDMKDVINAQMKIFNKIGLDLPVGTLLLLASAVSIK